MELLFICLLFAVGIFLVIRPDIIWKMEHFWSVKGGEPSDLHLAILRVAGALIFLTAFIMLILFLLHMLPQYG